MTAVVEENWRLRAALHTLLRDYGTIMRCKCGWRGPFYMMLVPVKYPGTARCPECKAEGASVDEQERQGVEE